MTLPPVADLDNAAFLTGLREHTIDLQRCAECARVRFPPMPACPWCGATGSERMLASGEGQVYSWITVHRALTPEFESDVPYTIATVELVEGGRIFARLDGAEPTAPGDDVVAVFVDHPEWTELRFRPAP